MTSNYALVNARWDEARAGFERLRTMSETIGYQRTWSIAVGSLHWIAAFEGRNDDADALAEEWQQTAEREDAQARVWALHALTLARLRRGEPDLALEPAKRSVDLLDEHIGREVALGTWAVRALVDARRGALDEAYGYAERASVYAQDRPMGFYVLYAHTALAEVYGRVAAASGSKRSSSRRMIATRGALQRMRRAFPLAAPASHRAAWQVALQAGQTAAAARAGAMALEAAREKGMIHEAEVMRRSMEDGQFYAL
jgi:ATP/maltotriose-dependent transcriptional regulator MalT